MSNRARYIVSSVATVVVLAILIALTLASPPNPADLVPALVFSLLIAFTTAFGVPLAGGRASLLPMATLAAYLTLGPVLASGAAFIGALLYGWLRYQWPEKLGERRLTSFWPALGVALANGTVQAASVLVGAWVYDHLGGIIPLTALTWPAVLPLLLLGLAYLGTNLFIVGCHMAAQGRELLQRFRRSLPRIIAYEGWPMILAPLVALAYTQLGWLAFLLLVMALVATSLVARNLSLTSRRLERRVRELDSLQAVGQALSASLDLDTILEAIYDQVANLMPVHNFYVALYDPDTDEVSFPLAREEGQTVHWRSRRAGNGLTEYVLRTRQTLLIREDYDTVLENLGIAKIGPSAQSWLGVPILAGQEPLGVVAVQSYSADEGYDLSHQEVLTTIAAQAAVAIRNARLYAQTDETLARRVQELNSILRTTQEGMLLFDLDRRVLAANPAAAALLGSAQSEMIGQDLYSPGPGGAPSLAERMGYACGELEAACQRVAEDRDSFDRQQIAMAGPPERHVERTLAAVRDRQGEINGWLLVLRDVSEEHELAQIREDLTNMLVHDLRSTLSVLTSCLDLIKGELAPDQMTHDLRQLIELGERSGARLLRLVSNLLDISRLESGNMELFRQVVGPRYLLENVAERLMPEARQAQIEVTVEAEPTLPPVYADPEIMDRVIHNLLDNALKFTPDDGQVRLWARVDDSREPATMLLGVSDTGPGIPLEARPRLFKKFQQVVSTSGRRMGTGLGLPFCKLAVEAHGGEIWVESEVGRGSTFVIRLPLA